MCKVLPRMVTTHTRRVPVVGRISGRALSAPDARRHARVLSDDDTSLGACVPPCSTAASCHAGLRAWDAQILAGLHYYWFALLVRIGLRMTVLKVHACVYVCVWGGGRLRGAWCP